MSDGEIRDLERRLAAARLRAGLTAGQCVIELLQIALRIHRVRQRYRKLAGRALDDYYDREHNVPREHSAVTITSTAVALRRRWRKVYRTWLRVTGNWIERETWLGPVPVCTCEHKPCANHPWLSSTGCGKWNTRLMCWRIPYGTMNALEHRLIRQEENNANHRFIRLAQRRKKIMDKISEARAKLSDVRT